MSTTLGSGNQIDIAFGNRIAALRQPQHGPVSSFTAATHTANEGGFGQGWNPLQFIQQIIPQTILVQPFDGLSTGLFGKTDAQSGGQYCLGPQHMLELFQVKPGTVEESRIGPEFDPGACIQLADLAHFLQWRNLLAAGKGNVVFPAVTFDPDLQMFGQGIDYRYTNAVQATGKLVTLIGEFPSGMQFAQNHLYSRHTFFRVDIHRHTPSIVSDFQRTILVQGHPYLFGIPSNGLIHAIVDDFLGQMIRPGGIGIHTGALTDRIQSAKYLNGRGIVDVSHL